MRQILTMIVLWFGSFWLRKKVLLCDLISRIIFKFLNFFLQISKSTFLYLHIKGEVTAKTMSRSSLFTSNVSIHRMSFGAIIQRVITLRLLQSPD